MAELKLGPPKKRSSVQGSSVQHHRPDVL